MNLPLVRHKIVITYRKFSIRYKTCKFIHYNYHYRGTGQWPDGRISLLLLCWHLYQTLAGNVLEISSEFNIHNVSLLYNTFLFILKGTALSCLKLSLYCMGIIYVNDLISHFFSNPIFLINSFPIKLKCMVQDFYSLALFTHWQLYNGTFVGNSTPILFYTIIYSYVI